MKHPWIFWLVLGTLALGCAQDSGPTVDGELSLPSYWKSLGRSGSDITGLTVGPGGLVVMERTGSVSVQRPAFTGAWVQAPLGFSDLEGNVGDLGLTAVAQTQDAIWIAAHLAQDDPRASLYTLRSGVSWEPIVPLEPVVRILDLYRDKTDALWRIDGDRVLVTAADGSTRQASPGTFEGIIQARLFAAEGSVLIAGWQGVSPLLRRSADGGRTWSAIPVPDGVRRVEAAGAAGNPEHLYAVFDGSVQTRDASSRKWTELRKVGRVPGGFFVNPADPLEVVVVAESIYLTRDGGTQWVQFPPPGPTHFETAAMDWPSGTVVVTVTDFLRDAVFAFDLAGAWAVLE